MDVEDIWSEYRASLKASLHARIANPADVEDLLQEILIKTYDNLHTIRSASSVRSWLFQVANHAIADFYRTKAKSRELTADDLWYGVPDSGVEQSLAGCITPFVNSLPVGTAELLTAIDLNGESQRAYADAHGMNYSTLKSRVQKGRNQLRSLFESCCHLTLDAQGNVADCAEKSARCGSC